MTAAQARLTPHNAVTEIDRLILTAWREKLPVYMELPSDIAYLDIEVPGAPLMLAQPPSDPERLRSCAAAIAGHLSDARSPAILVDQDADRYGAADEIMGLAEKMLLPVAVTGPAKAVIDETFPYYAGVYNGQASAPYTREAIEASDCLLSIGYRPIDGTLKEVLGGVIDAVPHVTNRPSRQFPAATAAAAPLHRRRVGHLGFDRLQRRGAARHDCKPVIFLINNGGYTIERGYLGKSEHYNDVATWAYADLPKVFRPGTTARSFVVKTVADLEKDLSAPNDSLVFVESVMDPHDAPAAVIHSSNNGAELDYGPRGPQHRDGVQLQPAT